MRSEEGDEIKSVRTAYVLTTLAVQRLESPGLLVVVPGCLEMYLSSPGGLRRLGQVVAAKIVALSVWRVPAFI